MIANELSESERNKVWSFVAIGREMVTLKNQSGDEKPSKPGSPFSVSILKIASICKGAGYHHLNRFTVFERIIANSQQYHLSEREIWRVWNRAIKTAVPRYPKKVQNGR